MKPYLSHKKRKKTSHLFPSFLLCYLILFYIYFPTSRAVNEQYNKTHMTKLMRQAKQESVNGGRKKKELQQTPNREKEPETKRRNRKCKTHTLAQAHIQTHAHTPSQDTPVSGTSSMLHSLLTRPPIPPTVFIDFPKISYFPVESSFHVITQTWRTHRECIRPNPRCCSSEMKTFPGKELAHRGINGKRASH